MDLLPRICVSGELSKEEFARRLNSAGSDEVSELRIALFEEAVCGDLADEGDVLVRRMKCGGKTVKGKHSEDVWSLVCSIRRSEEVPRVILRNGKRSREEFQQSQVLKDECAGWLQGDAYDGNDVADGTDVVLLMGKMGKMWGLMAMLISLLGVSRRMEVAQSPEPWKG